MIRCSSWISDFRLAVFFGLGFMVSVVEILPLLFQGFRGAIFFRSAAKDTPTSILLCSLARTSINTVSVLFGSFSYRWVVVKITVPFLDPKP